MTTSIWTFSVCTTLSFPLIPTTQLCSVTSDYRHLAIHQCAMNVVLSACSGLLNEQSLLSNSPSLLFNNNFYPTVVVEPTQITCEYSFSSIELNWFNFFRGIHGFEMLVHFKMQDFSNCFTLLHIKRYKTWTCIFVLSHFSHQLRRQVPLTS